MTKKELFIVDNSKKGWSVEKYLHEWCDISERFDIATGYFEIGAFLALDGQWQKLDKIRILMGDEVSKRTKQAFVAGLSEITNKLDSSIEQEKEGNDFLKGVPAIVEAIKSKKIECKVYRKGKFHAKAYITHSKLAVVGPVALVGSSNFTQKGLNENIELNIQVKSEVDMLQEWFEKHWDEAEDVTPEILKVIERHVAEYTPFEVYFKALHEFFRGHEMSSEEWEKDHSRVYNGKGVENYSGLDIYQKEGYYNLMKIAHRYNGAFLCDGVGLGKTYIGLMLIERLVLHEKKRVILVVPKAARNSVWEKNIRNMMPEILDGLYPFRIINHSDLLRKPGEINWPLIMEQIKNQADTIIIDEAHHFRNKGTDRYKAFSGMTAGKQVFMLTATPINNSLLDFLHMIELFSGEKTDYFRDAPLGIHSLRGHFISQERAFEEYAAQSEKEVNLSSKPNKLITDDKLFRTLVVQRSRAYAKRSQEEQGKSGVLFPTREKPQIGKYSLKKTYGKLLEKFIAAFDKDNPLLSLALYYPLKFYKGSGEEIDPMEEGREKQVVGLIRTLLLKRFESSAFSFQQSCINLLLKLLAFVELHDRKKAEHWRSQRKHTEILKWIKQVRSPETDDEEDADEDVIQEELKLKVERLIIDPQKYHMDTIIELTLKDLNLLVTFLIDLKVFKPEHDDKIQSLINLMRNDQDLQKQKVLIFTEFKDTANYVERELKNAGIDNVDEIDSSDGRDIGDIIENFSPYYNGYSSQYLKENKRKEIRVLVATDILAEGLNLQDASLMINYDLHWNPVRLMQRIGRVDRRFDAAVEENLVKSHPEVVELRGKVRFWNFLPPDELNDVLTLYKRVTDKTLRISKTLGIEGRQLLTPEDDYESLKEFNNIYEGAITVEEEMRLEYQRFLRDYPEIAQKLNNYPLRLFSGKEKQEIKSKHVFFCYELPSKNANGDWLIESGYVRWYLYVIDGDEIIEDIKKIVDIVRTSQGTPRKISDDKYQLVEIKSKFEKKALVPFLREIQAPIGIKPRLKAWMEIS